MYDTLLKQIANLGASRILVVGDYMLDVYIYGDATRISPEAPVPILKVKEQTHRCGGAASVAMNIAALGAEPICLGIIGNDTKGKMLKECLEKGPADTAALLIVEDRPTITKTRLIGLAQHRHQQQLFRMDEESNAPLAESLKTQLLEIFGSLLDRVDIVCLQDYNKGFLEADTCQAMIAIAKQAHKKILVDPAFGVDYKKYQGASLLTPNRQETALAVDKPVESFDDYKAAAEKLRCELELAAVVITLDKEGAFLSTDRVTTLIPTRARKVYDVTGAGDMVLAMLATALAGGCDYKTTVQLANIAGGLEVEKFGVATVSIEEIVNEIIGQHRGKDDKVQSLEALRPLLQWHRSRNDTIVFTNGCFDVLHRGHIEYLSFCKQQGNVVVVGLNSDRSVKAIKGPERPINHQFDRAAVLAALESVDYITIFEEPDPLALIKAVLPDVLVKGQDWQDKGVIGSDVVTQHGGKVVLAPMVEGKSSTSIIERFKGLLKRH